MSSKFTGANKLGANKLAANRLAMWLAAGAVVAMSFATPASADNKTKRTDDRGRTYYGPGGPNAVYQQGRTRLYVSKRSWLDGGTEVGYPSFARENLNRPIDRQPLPTPADLGGYPQNFPLY